MMFLKLSTIKQASLPNYRWPIPWPRLLDAAPELRSSAEIRAISELIKRCVKKHERLQRTDDLVTTLGDIVNEHLLAAGPR